MTPARKGVGEGRGDAFPATATRPRGMPVEPHVETRMKLERLRDWLARQRLDGVVFATRANTAWLTGGGDLHVVSQSEGAAAAIAVDATRVHLVANEIEIDRIQHEEPVRGFVRRAFPWARPLAAELARLLGPRPGAWVSDLPAATGLPVLADDFVTACRASLLPSEVARYEALGHDCASAVESVCLTVEPGDTERDVEARVAAELLVRGVQPAVVLVAADQRIRNFRHPVPTDRPLRRHLMVVACGERHGLVASLTRLVHFGPVPRDLAQRHEATCRVEAAMWEATVPGAAFGDVLAAAQRQYAREGVRDEWLRHHQGGPTGYAPRDFIVTPGEARTVLPYQAVAWNPSITGTKSEDTCIVLPPEPGARRAATPQRLVITEAMSAWPRLTVTAPSGARLARPGLLMR